jgi:hypothetical protein
MSKPWADKDAVPFQGGAKEDGGPVKGPSPYEKEAGTGGFHPPNPNPFSDDTAKRKPGGTV